MAEYKINVQNQLHFYTLVANYPKTNLGKKIPFTIASERNKLLRSKFNQGGEKSID